MREILETTQENVAFSEIEEQDDFVSEQFKRFKKATEASPNLEEKIPLRHLQEDSAECAALLDGVAGVDIGVLQQEGVSRRELLDKGFIFSNRIGNGEKPIIDAVIDGIDFGKKILLTKDELEIVKKYQASHPEEFGCGDHKLEDVCKDMLRFLDCSVDPRPLSFKSRSALLGSIFITKISNYYARSRLAESMIVEEFMKSEKIGLILNL